MDVSAADLAKVPVANLRVPPAEFGASWIAAEQFHDERVRQRVPDWYGAGVVITCRWLARATVRLDVGPWELARSPVTGRTARAFPELIEAECLAAEKLALRRPVPAIVQSRPGWLDGVLRTLGWAWRRNGSSPLLLGRDEPPGVPTATRTE